MNPNRRSSPRSPTGHRAPSWVHTPQAGAAGKIDAADWEIIIRARPNVLLSGSKPAIDAMLSALQPYLRRPIRTESAASERPLPGPTGGTVILEHVEACSAERQEALRHWLDGDAGHPQFISTTDPSLFTHVERGLFPADLYYRLNTVYVDLGTA